MAEGTSQFVESHKQRTKAFGVRCVRLVDTLPKRRSADVIGRQLLRSATSVGANYRAAQRARSHAEFRAKLGIVEEEADESVYWLEVLAETGLVPAEKLADLRQEALEILKITVRTLRTAKQNVPANRSRKAR
ncbi:MAG: four helix bundle protein [Planctomycetota bacterium]